MRIAVIIVAAGQGTRAGGGLPKQWRPLAGRRVIDWTIAAFEGHAQIQDIVVVTQSLETSALPARLRRVLGGNSRAASVRAGLDALPQEVTHVLVHDAARPCVSAQVIDRVIDALAQGAPGAAPGLAVTDALWRAKDGLVADTPDRAELFRAQTPQGFALPALRAAQLNAPPEAPDDVSVLRAAGLDVAIVSGEADNIKITTPEDFHRAARILETRMQIRTGNGFDVHRFCPGEAVTLCGISVPHTRGLAGHSDADVGMHALTDAIYGALAEGDIGRHFPPSDPQWRGADSALFLAHAAQRMRARGLTLGNADITLICEQPKIGPHAAAMAARLSQILEVPTDRISVKATTSERLGFTGREEGIAALASCTLLSPALASGSPSALPTAPVQP